MNKMIDSEPIDVDKVKDIKEGEIRAMYPTCLGWVESRLPKNAIDRLWSYEESAKKDWRSKLAGNISSSLQLQDIDDWFYLKFLSPLQNAFEKEFEAIGDGVPTSHGHPYTLGSFWINYQKQHEFNPPHIHTGVYSFTIWLKIPTDFREQHSLPWVEAANTSCASNFEFQYMNILGSMKSYSYKLDPSKEGIILFFPSELSHQVFPFYNCDEDRVSISGNLVLNSKKYQSV